MGRLNHEPPGLKMRARREIQQEMVAGIAFWRKQGCFLQNTQIKISGSATVQRREANSNMCLYFVRALLSKVETH